MDQDEEGSSESDHQENPSARKKTSQQDNEFNPAKKVRISEAAASE